jgi:hypothetical protein
MSIGIMQAESTEQTHATGQAQVIERTQATGQAQATGQPSVIGQAEEPPPMTAEAARRLAVILAPHLMAMRAVTAGTPYGACAGADPAAGDRGATSAAEVAQLPPASAATRIFIAGMLERLSA